MWGYLGEGGGVKSSQDMEDGPIPLSVIVVLF